ncbi:membrane protein [Deltaproteobacteria bacterium]|nr:membrane protein [Deltaproteobacteria bacterium]
MLHYLIRFTDTALSTTIVMAFFLSLVAAVSPKGRKGLWTAVVRGVFVGILVALAYAALKRNTGIAVREYYDLMVLGLSLPLSLVMLAVMWSMFSPAPDPGSPGLSALHGLPAKALAMLLMTAWTAWVLPDILLYPFAFSAGMESVYNTEFLFRVIGCGTGLTLMFLLAVGLYKTASILPRRYARAFFAALLLVFFAGQVLELTQILVGRNMIPRYSGLMSLLMFLLTHVNWFRFALMALALAATGAVIARIRCNPARGGNPAMIRKQRAERRGQMRYAGLVIVCLAVCALTISCIRAYANREIAISPPLELPDQNGKIIIPLERVNDGKLHRFVYKTREGTGVRFIVIRKSQTAYGVGLDACDICGPSGYYQRKGQVICKLCDVVMNIATIGFPGGCNPVPLRFSVFMGNMVIMRKDLDAEEQRFK